MYSVSPSFCNRGGSRGTRWKNSAIDDMKASDVNDLLGLADTSIRESLDVFLSMLLAHARLGSGRPMSAFSLDFAQSYKHVGVSADPLDFATVIRCDHHGAPHMATLKTQPFWESPRPGKLGARACVPAVRVDAVIRHMARNIFR